MVLNKVSRAKPPPLKQLAIEERQRIANIIQYGS